MDRDSDGLDRASDIQRSPRVQQGFAPIMDAARKQARKPTKKVQLRQKRWGWLKRSHSNGNCQRLGAVKGFSTSAEKRNYPNKEGNKTLGAFDRLAPSYQHHVVY